MLAFPTIGRGPKEHVSAAMILSTSKNGGNELLLVDDDPGASEAMRALLEIDGYRVSVAHRVDEALEWCSRFVPDVLISDFLLPDGDGCEIARTLAAKPTFHGLMIAVTGIVDDKTQAAIKGAGFDARFSKPLDVSAFRGYLRRMSAPHPN